MAMKKIYWTQIHRKSKEHEKSSVRYHVWLLDTKAGIGSTDNLLDLWRNLTIGMTLYPLQLCSRPRRLFSTLTSRNISYHPEILTAVHRCNTAVPRVGRESFVQIIALFNGWRVVQSGIAGRKALDLRLPLLSSYPLLPHPPSFPLSLIYMCWFT